MLNIGSLPVWLGYIFFALGMGLFALLVGITCQATYVFISKLINKLRWKYKYKHRFDKPPIAKCYCKDCRHYSGNIGLGWSANDLCTMHAGWHVAKNWFCWNAEPCEKDPSLEKESDT